MTGSKHQEPGIHLIFDALQALHLLLLLLPLLGQLGLLRLQLLQLQIKPLQALCRRLVILRSLQKATLTTQEMLHSAAAILVDV